MTCIAGAIGPDGTVYIGGDSCISTYNVRWNAGTTKVFRKGEALIGVAGDCKVLDLLQYHLTDFPETLDSPSHYLHLTVMPKILNLLKDWRWNTEEEYNWAALLGYKGKLYGMFHDFSIIDCPSYGFAVGSGEEVAMGSLHTTQGMKIKTSDRVMLALQASGAIVPSVCGPYAVHTLKPPVSPEKPLDSKKKRA